MGISLKSFRSPSRQGGMSMIELLVAVLVLGIGVLGITALQMVSLQNNRAALYRAEAVQLAYDMMDRTRANPIAVPVAGQAYGGVPLAAIPADPPALCHQAQCTEVQMVVYDLAMWKCSLGGLNDEQVWIDLRTAGALPPQNEQPGLPNGRGSIAVDAGTAVVTVMVSWQEPDGQVRNISIDSQS